MKKIIMHIDMNSYFATVEQQANPSLRGKPVGVCGSENKRTIVAAASVEAKRYGVRTGMRVHEAQAICPEIVLVIGEPRKYSSVTKKFIEIFERYTDTVEIFSIDEAFLDVTKTDALFGGAQKIAKAIKKDIRNEIGEWVSCSVGISYNKFLAKLGSDLQKPDGLVEITQENVDEILLSCKLQDFCGIASRISKRLKYLGIKSVQDLRDADQATLFKEFGSYGIKIYKMAYGVDTSNVSDWHNQSDAKSFGHSRTLNKDITDIKEIKRHIYLLSEKVAARMRAENYCGKTVFLWLRFKDFSHDGKRKKSSFWILDGYDIYTYASSILNEMRIKSPVRAIGVGVSDIKAERYVPNVFLDEDKTKEKIMHAMDSVNNRYGSNVLRRATIYDMELKKIVSGLGRKKF